MMERSRPLKGRWVLAVAAVVLVGGHVILFCFVKQAASRTSVSGAVISVVVLLVIAKHLGLLAALLRPIYDLFRRPPRD